MLGPIRGKAERLLKIVMREQAKLDRAQRRTALSHGPNASSALNTSGILSALHITYEGPGELRPNGPRHDNDFEDIEQIRVAPTHDELVSHTAPYLPANLHNAPHHLPSDSPARLLDIQFRLLREELTCV